jgi:DNA-binding transcriptional LysR family regulator
MTWDDVRLFLALCRSRTVGAAARSIGVDTSTVSRRLNALELELGTTLFDRGREGTVPTAAAEDLLPIAEEIEAGMLRFTTAAEGLERAVAGIVRLTCPPDVAQVVVVPLLKELFARHPALQVAIDPGETVLDLTRREADIALRTVRPVRGDLIVTKLADARWVLAGAPTFAKSLGTLRAWSDAPWITWGERLSGSGAARWFAQHAKNIEPRVRSDSLAVQLANVAAGIGVALVPEPSIAHFGLAPIQIAPTLRESAVHWPVDELFLVTHRALREVPRVRAVWDLLVTRMTARKKKTGR